MFFKKKEKLFIEFRNTEAYEGALAKPVKAKKALPEWFKRLAPAAESTVDCPVTGKPLSYKKPTAKKCIPMVEASGHGVMIPAWTDFTVIISRDENNELMGRMLMGTYGQDYGEHDHTWDQVGDAVNIEKQAGLKQIFKFMSPWRIRTPEGYSIFVKNPANHFNPDFELFEGVIDSDNYNLTINLPFFWKNGAEGTYLIEKGTPLAQVMLVKREDFDIKFGIISHLEINQQENKLASKANDRYKTLFWHKRKED